MYLLCLRMVTLKNHVAVDDEVGGTDVDRDKEDDDMGVRGPTQLHHRNWATCLLLN
ncbi:hypothetical protein Scep_019828 [Stephania cephalantha]|uniref:Uncharacterized protein n=1 Tax=Stephania cephalantha TaxID=152367 RepID=A0AAP0IBD9_9MAGN